MRKPDPNNTWSHIHTCDCCDSTGTLFNIGTWIGIYDRMFWTEFCIDCLINYRSAMKRESTTLI